MNENLQRKALEKKYIFNQTLIPAVPRKRFGLANFETIYLSLYTQLINPNPFRDTHCRHTAFVYKILKLGNVEEIGEIVRKVKM